MQKRIRKIASFFAFNILFFALYLNFIDKEDTALPQTEQQHIAAFGATQAVGNLVKSSNQTAQIK